MSIGEIGDTLIATPTAEAFREAYPAARLTLIARPSVEEIVRHNPHVDRILLWDGRSPIRRLRSGLAIARGGFDFWVDLHAPTFNTWCSNERVFRRNRFLMRLSRTRFRRAFAVPELRGALTHPEPLPGDDALRTENIVNTTLRLAPAPPRRGVRKVLVVPPAARAWAASKMTELSIDSPPIGLFFGSKQSSAEWPEANVVAFCRRVVELYPGLRFLLLGGALEQASARRLERELVPSAFPAIVNLVGQASLGQTAALVASCRAMVTTDSGPMHIADALGVPLVALFSSRNYLSLWAPLQPGAVVLNAPVPCGPCFLSVSANGGRCMASIRAEDVLVALARQLAREPG